MENKDQTENVVPTMPPTPKKQSTMSSIWEFVRFIIVALIIVIPIRVFVAQPFIVSGSSMVPTFENGQYLIVDELSYRFHAPARGDVIVFHPPIDPTKYYIKRVIGLPGDTVTIKQGKVTITNKDHPAGFELNEPYVVNIDRNTVPITSVVKDGQYFAMGDNRPASFDSRSWGTVPQNLITGTAFLRLIPLQKIGIHPGDYKQAE